MVKFLIDLYYMSKRIKDKKESTKGLEKFDMEKEWKKFVKEAKKIYDEKKLWKIRPIAPEKDEFPHVIEHIPDVIKYAEKYGLIKKVRDKIDEWYELTEIANRIRPNATTVWFAGKLAEKLGVEDKEDFVYFLEETKNLLLKNEDLPYMLEDRYKEEFSDWYKFLKEFERRFVERYKDDPVVKKYIEKMGKIHPRWKIILEELDAEVLHVEEAKNLLRILRSMERSYDEAVSHLEDMGEIREYSFEMFIESIKRKHDERDEAIFESLKEEVYDVARNMKLHKSAEVLYISKEIAHRIRMEIGRKLMEKIAEGEEQIYRSELLEMYRSLMKDVSELHIKLRGAAM